MTSDELITDPGNYNDNVAAFRESLKNRLSTAGPGEKIYVHRCSDLMKVSGVPDQATVWDIIKELSQEGLCHYGSDFTGKYCRPIDKT